MTETSGSISGNQVHRPSEDEMAHQFYLASIGLADSRHLDPDYADTLREMTATRTTAPINELAAELPESQAAEETVQLKFAMSPTEGKIAAEITERIRRANLTRQGNPARAVANTYQAVVHQLTDANNDLLNLHTVLESPEHGDPYVSAALIRENPAVIETMAKYIRVMICTRKNFWPQYNQPEFREQRMFAKGMAMDIAQNAQDASLERFVGSIYKLAENRFRFWSRGRTIAEAAKPVKEKVLSDPTQTFSMLLPQRREGRPDEERRDQADLPEPALHQPEEAEAEISEQVSPFSVPESARPEDDLYLAGLAEKDAEVARRVEQGFTNRSTEERNLFQGTPIRDKEGRVVGVEKGDDQPAKRGSHSKTSHSKGKGKGKKSRTWSRLGKDSGPPPHIAKEVRRAQGLSD